MDLIEDIVRKYRLAPLEGEGGWFRFLTRFSDCNAGSILYLVSRDSFSSLHRLDTDELKSRLLSIKGVGQETASVILLYAFRRPVFVLDAYTRQLLERLGFSFSSDCQRLEYLEKGLDGDVSVFGYYHWLILELCKAWCRKKPLCSSCPLRQDCRRGSSEPVSAS